MKKILFLFVALAAIFTVSACDELVEDGAQALLDEAIDSLNGVIGDPSNITTTFQVPTSLMNGVVATWTSSEPGVIEFSAPVGGLATATVNRPAFGEPDASVTLTAVLVIESQLDALQFLSGEYQITVTVKASEVEELVIENIADILAIRDVAYDRAIEVTLSNLTIIGKGSDGVFAYDGTGITQLYGSNVASVEVGKVYTVTGTPDWYFGLWELVNWTAVEQVGATPQMPTQQTVTDVSGFIADLVEDGENTYASQTAAAGAFEPIYAKVSGLVYVIPGNTGNYNTYILNSDFVVGTDTFTEGVTGVPATGLMVYYNTLNFADLRLYDGIPVTIDVIIHTYRSNNNAFALYYVGGAEGIEANLSDEQKLAIDSEAVTLPLSSIESTTLNLPTVGANGASIVWSFTDAQSANNQYVDLTTGAATAPAGSQVSVGLTATITVGSLDPVVKTFVFKIGEYPISTVAEAKVLGDGAFARVVGVITDTTDDAANGAYWFQDATGGFNLFDRNNVLTPDLIGKTVEIIAEVDVYNGLLELLTASLDTITVLTGDAVLPMPEAVDISAMTLDSETLLPYQGMLVDLKGFVLKAGLNATYTASFNMIFVNASGQQITVRADKDVPGFADFVLQVASAQAGAAFDFEDVILSWFNGPQIMVASNATITAGTAYTDQQLLDTAAAFYTFPAKAADEITASIALGTPLFGATVTLTSTNTAVVATDGTVTRPANGSGNANVTLGYTLTLNAVSTTEVTVDVVVLEEAPANSDFASDLFISEYIEGTPGNRKAIEIYNGTGADVTLDGVYTLKLNTNANTTWGSAIALTGTIAAGDVFVVYYDDSTNNDMLGTFGDFESTAIAFNGDDAIGLFKNDVLIDIFGVFGEDPGDGWTVSTIANATKDGIITRNPGATGPSAVWDPSEWTRVAAYVDGTVTTLGSHTN